MRLEIGIIRLVEEVIGIPAERRAQFDWLRNKPRREDFGEHYDTVIALYTALEGDWEGTRAKADGYLTPDAYFPDPYHFILSSMSCSISRSFGSEHCSFTHQILR